VIQADPDPFGSAVAEAPARKPAKELPGYMAAPAQPGKPFTVVLPYPPTSNLYWRSRIVTPKVGKPFVSHYISPEGAQFKEAVGWLLRSAGIRQPLAGRVQVDLHLWPHRPLDWVKRAKADPLYWADTVQRLDLDNCRKALNDALKYIAFGDDKCVWKDSGEVMEPDGRDACLVVTITPLVKVNPQGGLL
jgi:crossover junction endodeoxyribonuclease RusA